jgi:cyclophilin family peptidyl-prolyl cis-trans isomerase
VRASGKRAQPLSQRPRSQLARLLALGTVGLLVFGALAFLARQVMGDDPEAGDQGEPVGGDRPLAEMAPTARADYYGAAPAMVIDAAKKYEAVIRTAKGDMRIRLFAAEAPKTVNNFVYLANQGFYDGTIFHRVLSGFMAQGGDPTGTGRGGPGYRFEDETANGLTFDRAGLLAMANAGPNTNGSQFFITFVPTPHLNGAHTIFGELIEGQDILSSISLVQPGGRTASGTTGDVIERIDIYEVAS